jgi:hypothetical protein
MIIKIKNWNIFEKENGIGLLETLILKTKSSFMQLLHTKNANIICVSQIFILGTY